jgi:rsbT co-antagonist protein RsbR
MAAGQVLQQILGKTPKELLPEWLQTQIATDSLLRSDLMKEGELREQSREFLGLLQDAVRSGVEKIDDPSWEPVKEFLGSISRSRALLAEAAALRAAAQGNPRRRAGTRR